MTKAELAQFPGELHKRLMESTRMWQDIYHVCEYARLALFYGPPGTGKSTVQCKHGLKGRNLQRVVLTAETVKGEIAGQKEPVTAFDAEGRPCGTQLAYVKANGLLAWERGDRLVIEEINEASGDTVPFLHLLLDGEGVAQYTLPDGSTVRPHENFQCYASMNVEPTALPEALNDRFVIKRLIDAPDPRLLLSLPRCLRPAAAFSLYGNTAGLQVTTRQWVALGQVMDRHGWSIADAVEFIFGPRGNAKQIAKAIEVRSAIGVTEATTA